MQVDCKIPEVFLPLFDPYEFKVYSSGRGAAKSWSFARVLVCKALEERLRILCCREIQTSIRDSVHKLLKDQIDLLGLMPFFHITRDMIVCRRSGSEFIFKGLRDLRASESVKSIENIKICWVEEAQSISKESLDLLIPTIRMAGSEIWFSINPRFASDPVYEMFLSPDSVLESNWLVKKISWRDNPYFTEELKKKMERDRWRSESTYEHVWEGALSVGQGNIFSEEWLRFFDPDKPEKYLVKMLSIDSAFSKNESADYSVVQEWHFNQEHLDLKNSLRGQWSFPELISNVRAMHRQMVETNLGVPPGPILIENKSSGQSLAQALETTGYNVQLYNPKKEDKVARANNASLYFKMGNIRVPLPTYAGWVQAFINEILSFRDDMKHEHDDQVDALSQIVYAWRQSF